MNDEKYLYFTERIQNTLLKPEILKFMKQNNNKDKVVTESDFRQRIVKQEEEKKMSREDLMKMKQQEHEKRKKERVEKLQATQHQEILEDPQFKKDKAQVVEQKELAKKSILILHADKVEQKDSI